MDFFSYPVHPRLVHFPIAFLLAGSVIAMLNLRNRDKKLEHYSMSFIATGWLFAIPAMITGLFEQGSIIPIEQAQKLVRQHITSAFASLMIFALSFYINLKWKSMEKPGKTVIQLVLLLAGSLMLIYTAHLGGRLVFEFGTGVK